MKLRRFTDAGVDAVRALLPQIKTVDDLARAEALATNDDFAKPIDELASIDLDETRVFPTTFAFCEYFHSLIKDHKPLSYRTDTGFWTWLAMVYVRQLVHKDDRESIGLGSVDRLVYAGTNFSRAYRHLLAHAFYLFHGYSKCVEICHVVLIHPLNSVGDLPDKILSNQTALQNPAIMKALNALYFDEYAQKAKVGAGGDKAGAVRRFMAVLDQFSMTRDFFEMQDSESFLALLPDEFNRFKK